MSKAMYLMLNRVMLAPIGVALFRPIRAVDLPVILEMTGIRSAVKRLPCP